MTITSSYWKEMQVLFFEYVNVLKEMFHPIILCPFLGWNWAYVPFLNIFYFSSKILYTVFFVNISAQFLPFIQLTMMDTSNLFQSCQICLLPRKRWAIKMCLLWSLSFGEYMSLALLLLLFFLTPVQISWVQCAGVQIVSPANPP